jgi:hypothetical protein
MKIVVALVAGLMLMACTGCVFEKNQVPYTIVREQGYNGVLAVFQNDKYPSINCKVMINGRLIKAEGHGEDFIIEPGMDTPLNIAQCFINPTYSTASLTIIGYNKYTGEEFAQSHRMISIPRRYQQVVPIKISFDRVDPAVIEARIRAQEAKKKEQEERRQEQERRKQEQQEHRRQNVPQATPRRVRLQSRDFNKDLGPAYPQGPQIGIGH